MTDEEPILSTEELTGTKEEKEKVSQTLPKEKEETTGEASEATLEPGNINKEFLNIPREKIAPNPWNPNEESEGKFNLLGESTQEVLWSL